MTISKQLRPRKLMTLTAAAVLPFLGMISACELFEESASVDVLSTHHVTPDSDGEMRTPSKDEGIETDMGWTVILTDAVVTTAAVRLVECNGTAHAIDMYWGAYPENLVKGDMGLSGLGGVTVPTGEYCKVEVDYAPFEPDGSTESWETEVEGAVGTTVYLRGIAVRGDEVVEFEWQTDREISVTIDVSQIDGGSPFLVEESDSYNTKLTVAKTYDRFFDGVEFDEVDVIDQDALIADTLSRETRGHAGTKVRF